MPKYYIFQGNFKQLMDGIPPVIPPEEHAGEATAFPAYFYQPMTKQDYHDQLNADINRGNYISFEQPIINFQSTLYSPDHYESAQVFNQGDLSGQFLEAILEMVLFNKDEYRDKKIETYGTPNRYTSTIYFAYLDGQNIPCSIAIQRFGIEGDTKNPHKYIIYHTRNTTGSATEKEITLISEEALLEAMNAQTLSNHDILEENIFTTIRPQIGSDKIYQLVSSLLEGGKISKLKFDALLSRIKADTNIDNRDVRQKILEEWLDCIQQIDPSLASEITTEAAQDINFFETSRFESLLFDRIHVSDQGSFNAIGRRLYAVQLRYLISNIYNNLTEKDMLSIRGKLIQHNPIFAKSFSYPQVQKDIQRLYAAEQFQRQLYKLDQYIHQCRQPYRCEEANNLLKFCRNKVDFDRLSPYGQEQLMTLIEHWCEFKQYPDTQKNAAITQTSYQSIVALYNLFNIREPDHDHILQTPDQARITWVLQQQPQSFTFDPQGRIIYDTVDHQGYRVTVSNDICDTPHLQATYIQTVREALQAHTSHSNAGEIVTLLQRLPSTATIRPLQQELHVFLSQIAHECQQTYQDKHFNEHDCQAVLNTTMQHVSYLVMDRFATALIRAKTVNGLNVAMVNETLNTAWTEIAPDAQAYLHDQIATRLSRTTPIGTPIIDIDCPLLRGTSTPLVHTDKRLGLATWIDSRHPNPHFTHRYTQSYALNSENMTITRERNRTQAILPTIVRTQDSDTYQQEFNEQLTYTNLFYSFKESFTYHTFPEFTKITAKELQQTLSTMHNFNRRRIVALKALEREDNLVLGFCDTLSIMPNHRPLGYRSYELFGLGNEATLMTEMALIQQLAPDELDTNRYQAFLVPEPPTTYLGSFLALFRSSLFSQTKEGKRTQADIKAIKTTWQEDVNLDISYNTEELLTQSLKKILAFDLHFGSKFNTLTQALTLAHSKQSLVAHSENSRAPYFLCLIQTFDRAPIDKKLLDALQELIGATDLESAQDAASALQLALQQNYHRYNTYGAATQATAMDDKALAEVRLEIPRTAKDLIEQSHQHGSYSRVLETMPIPAPVSTPTAKVPPSSELKASSSSATVPPKTAASRKNPAGKTLLAGINRKLKDKALQQSSPNPASKPPRPPRHH